MRSKKRKNNLESKELNYKIFYGIPHSHTEFSTGKGSPINAIKHAKANKLNFLFITDHLPSLKKSDKWKLQQEIIGKYNGKKKSLLALWGFEHKFFSNLEINVINSSNIINEKQNLLQLTNWLKNNNCICILNHPGDSTKKIQNELHLNDYITSIEVGNGSFPANYKRYYYQYYNLLDAGWKIGAVNGQDNHKENWGDFENLTAVCAEKLDIKNIIEGFRNKRTYSTESRTLKIDFKVNNCFMGDTISSLSTPFLYFHISAEDKNNIIDKMKIISNGGVVVKESPAINSNLINYSFTLQHCYSNTWYVVNIILADGREALTSPIFIDN